MPKTLVRGIRFRTVMRRIFSGPFEMAARERAYLDKYPWLWPLIPLGSHLADGEGIKFDDFLNEERAASEHKRDRLSDGVIYLVDTHGVALSRAGAPIIDPAAWLWNQLERALCRLPLHVEYVHYVVWVRGPIWYRQVRIYRVAKGENLAKKPEKMFARFKQALLDWENQIRRNRQHEYDEAAREAGR